MCGRDLLKGKTPKGSAYGRMQPGVGLRGWMYLVCGGSMVSWLVLGWTGVYLQLLPPDPTDDYAAMTAFVCLWMSVFAFVDNKGEKRSWEAKAEEFVYVWLLTSGYAPEKWFLLVVIFVFPVLVCCFSISCGQY